MGDIDGRELQLQEERIERGDRATQRMTDGDDWRSQIRQNGHGSVATDMSDADMAGKLTFVGLELGEPEGDGVKDPGRGEGLGELEAGVRLDSDGRVREQDRVEWSELSEVHLSGADTAKVGKAESASGC